jgi:hypothetical protein
VRVIPGGPSWTCAMCVVTLRFAPGTETPDLPSGWARCDEGLRCLRCARARVVVIALTEAIDTGDTRADLAIERDALARFELRRDDSRSNSDIASAIGGRCPPKAIAAARRALAAEA